MSGDSLVVTSATGVDVELAIAGAGSRCYAFLIDWHIRLVLVLAWYVGTALVLTHRPFLTNRASAHDFGVALVPGAVMYFLYHPLVELAMRGQTPGKRSAGVRIVTRQGGTPTTVAILIRNAFRLIDSLPAFYGVGLVTTLFTAQRVRFGDLAAGTLMVHSGEPEKKALAQLDTFNLDPTLEPGALALANDLLLRWKDLEPARRQQLARELLSRLEPPTTSAAAAPELQGDYGLQKRLRAALSRHAS